MGSQLDTQALADLHRLREQRDAAETRCGELVEALVTSESKLKSLREVAACTSCGDEFEQRSRPHCRNCYACQEEGCAAQSWQGMAAHEQRLVIDELRILAAGKWDFYPSAPRVAADCLEHLATEQPITAREPWVALRRAATTVANWNADCDGVARLRKALAALDDGETLPLDPGPKPSR